MAALSASRPLGPSHYHILTPRLLIRNSTASDIPAYHALRTNGLNHPHSDYEPDSTVDMVRERVAKMQDDTSKGKYAFLAFTLRETGDVVGFGSYNPFELAEPAEFLSNPDLLPQPTCVCDIGMMIDHRYWRKGYGLEIFVALIEHARSNIGCGLFLLETEIENEPWRKLMRAAELGRFEKRTPMADGEDSEEQWSWRFDARDWDNAKQQMLKTLKWPLL